MTNIRNQDSWVAHNGAEPLLPGLDYTPRQLFWISGANVWCAKHRLKSLEMILITGTHPPDRYRIQVSIVSEGFSLKSLISGDIFKYGGIFQRL